MSLESVRQLTERFSSQVLGADALGRLALAIGLQVVLFIGVIPGFRVRGAVNVSFYGSVAGFQSPVAGVAGVSGDW